jgi:hypothetical protein
MQIKYNYTAGGEFQLNGKDYIGYFNVDDKGNFYTGRYYDGTSNELIAPISEFATDYHRSKYFKDRFVFDKLKLPYELDEILIQPNEIVDYSILNKKITALQDNLIYMYSQLFMGSTDVPVDNNANILCNPIATNDFVWYKRPSDPNTPFGWGLLQANNILSSYNEYDFIKRFVVVPFNNDEGLNIVAISNTHVFAITSTISDDGQLSGAQFTLYTELIDNDTNEKCLNLEDITFDGRYIYISDSKINGTGQVFKYDVSSYYTNDAAFEGKKYLIEAIGGFDGGTRRNDKFNGCTVLGSKPREVWVYDSGNNCIKVYDDNFVWKNTLKMPNIGVYKVLDIRHRVMNNSTYVLYENISDPERIKYGLFHYDNNYKLVNTYEFEDIIYPQTDGKFNRIAVSEQDSNVFYVSTNSSIFKKFFSKPEKTFAVFNRNKFYSGDLFVWDLVKEPWAYLSDLGIWNYAEFFMSNFNVHDIFVSLSKNNRDNVFITGDAYIAHLNEKTDYVSLLRKDNLPYYNYDKIKFTKNEYNQALILNKEIYKLFANIIQFKNNLKGRFYAEFNEYGDLVYKDYVYLADEEINTIDIELTYNTFVNDNELVEPNVLNRIFNKIYDLQLALLKLTNVRIDNYRTWVDFTISSNIYPID